jgi:ketosteroid isomerase-like protein
MNKLLFVIILFLSGIRCYSQQGDQATVVGRFLDDWHAAAARADAEAYFGATAPQGIYIGTDKSERWSKQEFYRWSKRYFDAGKAWSFTAKERHIYFSADGNVAWFDEEVDNGRTQWRGSGVLERTKNGWKIMQYVLSVPIPNEVYPAVFEMIKEHEAKQPEREQQPQ